MKLSLDSIKKRHSTRTYDGTPLTREERSALYAAFEEATPGPFGSSPRFMLASRGELELPASGGHVAKERVRIGTYGLIVGPRDFIAGVIKRSTFACVDYGYCLEGLILRATELGLDTCWVGGAFGRGAVARALQASGDEFVPAMTPVGRAARRPSLQELASRMDSRPHSRMESGELFFEAARDGSWATLRETGEWKGILEAGRIGPSARNMQPWRIVLYRRSGEALHLVMHENTFYNNILGLTKLQELDMGIAMRHVEVASAELGVNGKWKRLDSCPVRIDHPRRYISSFIRA